jgi:hypothetical protein
MRSRKALWTAGLFAAVVLASAHAAADILDEITRQQPGVTKRHSSGLFDPESNADAYHLAPGEQMTVAELAGPGEIRHLWFTIAGADRRYPRSLVLRIYWDGAEVPSVETPIGDFFAAGNGMRANVASTPIEVTSYGRALNSYWHMPFRKRARVELLNESKARLTVYCQINWLQLPALPDNTLYFHARYHQEFPVKPFSPYVIFEGAGQGQYVGTVLSSQNSLGSWFGESDDRYYVDGEETPSLVGTGTEDYFTDAWNLRLFTHPNAGVTICEPKGVDCRLTCYRWQLHAPVIFRKSLKVEIERRSFAEVVDPITGRPKTYDFKYRPDFFSSVAFWYQKGIAQPFCKLPPLRERLNPELWIEVKDLVDQLGVSPGIKPVVRSNRICQGKTMFYLENDQVGAWLEIPLEIREEGPYSLSVFQVLSGQYGAWKVSLSGQAVHAVLDPALDFYDPYVCLKENWPESQVYGTLRESKLGIIRLLPGRYRLRFECVGSNPLSQVKATRKPGCSLAMDAVSMRKLPWDQMDRWMADYLRAEESLVTARTQQARQKVRDLAEAVDRFAHDTGGYPSDLRELLSPPPRLARAADRWPYLPTEQIPLDPWGQPYRYEFPGRFHPRGCDIYSVRGNSRDPAGWIGNWETPYRLKDAIEGESLSVVAKSDTARAVVQELHPRSVPPLSAGKQMFVKLGSQDAWMTFALPESLRPGRYVVRLYTVASWDYGVVQWSLDERKLGDPIDGYAHDIVPRIVNAGEVTMAGGKHELRVRAVDRNPRSTGYSAGLDAIVLEPAE